MVVAATPGSPGPLGSFDDTGAATEPVGSVADEAARLLHVLTARAAARAGFGSRATSSWTSRTKARADQVAEKAGRGTRQPGVPTPGQPSEARLAEPSSDGSVDPRAAVSTEPPSAPAADESLGESVPIASSGSEPRAQSCGVAAPGGQLFGESDQPGAPGCQPFGEAPQPGPRDRPDGAGHAPGERFDQCETCGCVATFVCAACPICRGAGVARLFSPQVLDAVADLAGLAAGALREAAARQREADGCRSSRGGQDAPGWMDTTAEPATPPREEY